MENSLGLDVNGAIESELQIQPSDLTHSTASPRIQRQEDTEDGGDSEEDGNPAQDGRSKKDKGKPYVPATPPARAKLSPEELAERMEKIRLQNEKIKERREHVKADEEAFNTSVAADRARQAANRKVQAQINQNREQNAKRKLEKMGNREWDSGKNGGDWKQGNRGRGRPSSGLGKDTEGLRVNSRKTADVSHSSASDSADRPNHESGPHITRPHTIDSVSPRSAVREAEKQD